MYIARLEGPLHQHLSQLEYPSAVLESLLAAVPGFVTLIELDGTIKYINLAQRGLPMEGVLGRSVFSFIDADHHDTARACFAEVVRTGERHSYRSQAQDADGNTANYLNHVQAVVTDGIIVGLCIVGVDVSEQIGRTRALQESERHYGFAIAATGLGVWSMDLLTGDGYWSDRMRDICGIQGPLSFDSFQALVHPDDRARSAASQVRLMADGQFQDRVRILVDGETRWVETHGRTTFDQDGTPIHIAGGMLDITAQQQTESRLRSAEKMKAVGEMTAGVAHNFNNMLQAIIPSLDFLEDHVDQPGQEHLVAAQEVMARARDMIQKLTAFARPNADIDVGQSSIAVVVAAAISLARRTLSPDIRISSTIDVHATVRGSEPELTQVMLNLLLNAGDALADPAVTDPAIQITVSALTDSDAAQASAAPGAFARIAVSDNGPGIAESALDRVFEPFFTTKGPDGSGLGLATSYAVVERAGGWMAAHSERGRGALFEVVLPMAGLAATPLPEPPAVKPAPSITCRVLVVDDEALVRRVAARALTRAGFEVVTSASVAEAKAVISQDRDFQLVVVDRSMPDAPGRDLVGPVRELLPDAKIAFLTGDPLLGADEHIVDAVFFKPLSANELVAVVRELLSAP